MSYSVFSRTHENAFVKVQENHKLEINRQSKKNERLPHFLADTPHTFRLNPWLLELDSGTQLHEFGE